MSAFARLPGAVWATVRWLVGLVPALFVVVITLRIWGLALGLAITATALAHWATGKCVSIAILIGLVLWARIAPDSWRRQVAVPMEQRRISRFVRHSWPTIAIRCGLAVTDRALGELVPSRLARRSALTWRDGRLTVRLELMIGQTLADVRGAMSKVVSAVGARSGTAEASGRDVLLRFDFEDSLREPFAAQLPHPYESPRTDRVSMGRTERGQDFSVALGPQTLLVGSSGSGKASLIWSFVAGLGPAIRAGLVEVHAIDLKGGMELAMGAPLFTRFATTPAEAVQVLEDAASRMQSRATRLSGVTRQHEPSLGEPLVIVLVDEFAAISAYLTDRDLKGRAAMAVSLLCSQGRAVGFMMFGALQDPRKETLPSRGLFTQAIGLRLKDADETRMVLGDGSVSAGAMCHEIPRSTPGVGFVVTDDGGDPVRFRAGFVDDQAIAYLATQFAAPVQEPVVVAETSAPVARPRVRRLTKEDAA